MDDKYECLKLKNQLCFPLYACAKEIVRRYKPVLDPLDLTYTQYIAMIALWDNNKLSVKELGEILFLDSGTLTPVLKKLEQKGYITRTRSSADERSLIVELTPDGLALRDKALSIPEAMCNCMKLTEEETTWLVKILHIMMDQIEKDGELR